jgi:hypothetical protein
VGYLEVELRVQVAALGPASTGDRHCIE